MEAMTADLSSESCEDFVHSVLGGEAVFLAQDRDGAVLDELVWPADAYDGGFQACV